MATVTKKETEAIKETEKEIDWNELVPFYAFKDGGKYREDIVVNVNGGKTWQIQRGKQVMIPRYVYEVIKDSMEQDAATAEMITSTENEFIAEAKKNNL